MNKLKNMSNKKIIVIGLISIVAISLIIFILSKSSSNPNYLSSSYADINKISNEIYNELNESLELTLDGIEYAKYVDGYYNVVKYHDKYKNSYTIKFDKSNKELLLINVSYNTKSDFMLIGLSLAKLSVFNFSSSEKAEISKIITEDIEEQTVGRYEISHTPSLKIFNIKRAY